MSLVDVRREGQVCVLTLQREEKLNALSGAMERKLLEALGGNDLRASRCVVITGAGKAFSAGADINEFAEADPASIAAYYADTGSVYERIAAHDPDGAADAVFTHITEAWLVRRPGPGDPVRLQR